MNFMCILELEQYRKKTMKLSSDNIFNKYLSKIYSNLIQREEAINNKQSKRISSEKNYLYFFQKDLYTNNFIPDKSKQNDINLSLNNFLDYLGIQEFIGEIIYNFLKKDKKSEKINKNEFCNGLNNLYYGNINDLIKLSFSLADFNKDGKIYKTDMKLILAYIPRSSEISQNNYIQQINRIINNFFDRLKKGDEEKEQEISLEIFQKYVNEYNNNMGNKYKKHNKKEKQKEINSEFSNDYNFNAPFFYFTTIISYLLKNLPFVPKTVEYFANNNNKKKKLSNFLTPKKNVVENIRNKYIITENNRIKLFNVNSPIKDTFATTAKKFNFHSNNPEIIKSLPKINKVNLFPINRSNSQIEPKIISNNYIIKSESKNKNVSRNSNKRDFIVAKDSLTNNYIPSFTLFQKPEKPTKNILPLFRSSYKASKKMKLLSPNHNNMADSNIKLFSPFSVNRKNVTIDKKIFLGQKFSPKSINNKEKNLPFIGVEPILNTNKEKSKNNFNESEEMPSSDFSEDDIDDKNDVSGKKNNESEKINEAFLYINKMHYFQVDNLIKYYALIRKKEIIFFLSEKKTDYYDLWYINKSYITIGNEFISEQNYYTIIITNENNFVNKLYFTDENICKSFFLSLKNSIKDYNFNDYYDLMDIVGEGYFGKVHKCKNKNTGDIFAVKILNKAKLKPKDMKLIRQEKNILNLIKHENIIGLKDYFEDKENIYFISEFCEGGDLFSYIDKKNSMGEQISEKKCARIIYKIAECINYLNFFGIIHRDIKPENIMFASPYNYKTLKLIDLGVCKILSFGEKTNELLGTDEYISPEIYLHHDYSFKIDIWSLGIVLYFLSTGGYLPFDDENSDIKKIAKKVCYLQQEYPKEFFGNKSKRLIDLLDKMLEKNEDKRININNLLKDCWFDIIKK